MSFHITFGMVFRTFMFVAVGAILSTAGIGTSSWQLYVILICMGLVQFSAQVEEGK